ncbi:MAG: hypothetical protein BWY29_00205 [Microgenomates group bacterium ADurb.Bin238]|nr:MAG: hypothetical protein BWY29_00205 [Microgenomates group bacterium ADurb.Bin238]
MIERSDSDRHKLIEDYKIVFDSLPQLEHLALSYWERTKRLKPSPNAVEEEKYVFHNIIFQMANILLNDEGFQRAMEEEGVDAVENAIIECVLMVETVLDIDESNNDNQ